MTKSLKLNRLIYFITCVAALVLASFRGGPVTYTLLFGLLLIAPISLIYLLVVYVFFKLYQVLGSKHITAYEPVPYYFVLKNEYLLNFCRISISMYSTFSYIDGLEAGAMNNYELLPGESVRYDGTLICRYKGEYNTGIKAITIVDFFRLFKVTYKVPEPLGVRIFPRIVKIEQPKSFPDISVTAHRENTKLNTDYDAAVREYVPGDPQKGIHWKLTAKTGTLKSRLTYGEQKRGISIFLDTKRMSKDEYVFIPLENKCLETALALANYFSAYSIPTTIYYDQAGPVSHVCSSPQDIDRTVTKLASIKYREDEDTAQALGISTEIGAFSDCMIAFVIITTIDAEVNKRLYALSHLGIKVIVYYVSYSPELNNILSIPDIKVITVHPEDDLTEIL
ncbi:MAG: DUF58 domain-containing protein [Lachnospiraceae bacterium]|nr:DUF58 domain-containing protein [Lachnospiraceae bacterium]